MLPQQCPAGSLHDHWDPPQVGISCFYLKEYMEINTNVKCFHEHYIIRWVIWMYKGVSNVQNSVAEQIKAVNSQCSLRSCCLPKGWIHKQIESWDKSLLTWRQKHVEQETSQGVWRLKMVSWTVIRCWEENEYIRFSLMFPSAVHEQRDAAECLQKILHHISPEASEVSTY